jgi:hypothetical protein
MADGGWDAGVCLFCASAGVGACVSGLVMSVREQGCQQEGVGMGMGTDVRGDVQVHLGFRVRI